MKSFSFLSSALLTSSMLVSLPALASYNGPVANPVETSLAQILKKPKDDQPVRLSGYLTHKISGDKYTFSDGKHSIRVEVDQYAFPSEPFNEKTRIIIEGEVEKDFMEAPEIDVDRVIIE